ncbi:MAG: DUF488 family protein [Variovorax sp.]
MSDADATVELWLKELAPSTALRKRFGHDRARWPEFRARYAEEVLGHTEALSQLRKLAGQGPITLVYSARDEVHNDAIVLRNLVLGRASATSAMAPGRSRRASQRTDSVA